MHPVNFDSDLSAVITSHFCSDFSEYISFFPNIIPRVADFPLDFKENVLGRLIQKCGKSPSYPFVRSVRLLIESDTQLAKRTISLCEDYKMHEAIIQICANMFSDRHIFDSLCDTTRNYYDFIVNLCVNKMKEEKITYGLFESIIRIFSFFLRYFCNTDKYQGYKDVIHSALNKDIDSKYRSKLFLLTEDIKDIQFSDTDYDSLKGAKLEVAVRCFLDREDLNTASALIDLFFQLIGCQNDLFCTYVEFFSKCSDIILTKYANDKAVAVLRYIFESKLGNWVQKETLVKFIGDVSPSIISRHIEDYERRVVDMLLEFSLDNSERLRTTANSVLVSFMSYELLPYTVSKLLYSDFLNEDICSRRFNLIASLSQNMNSSEFLCLRGMAFELLEYASEPETMSNIYIFLNNVPIDSITSSMVNYCYSIIEDTYQQFTYTSSKSDFPGSASTVESVDTDIIANTTFSHVSVLKLIQTAFQFLCSLQNINLLELDLFPLLERIWPLLDSHSVQSMFQYLESIGEEQDIFQKHFDIFYSLLHNSRDESVIAICLKYIINHELEEEIELELVISLFVQGKNIDILINCLLVINYMDPDESLRLAREKLENSTDLEIIPFISRIFSLSEKFISLIFEMFDTGKIADNKKISLVTHITDDDVYNVSKYVYSYINTFPFSQWYLSDLSINKSIVKLIKSLKQRNEDGIDNFTNTDLNFLKRVDRYIYVSIDSYNLDFDHWKFIQDNLCVFNVEDIKKNICNHRDSIRKIDFPVELLEKEKFHLDDVCIQTDFSLSLSLLRGRFVKSLPLIISYLKFSSSESCSVATEYWDQIWSLILDSSSIDGVRSFLNYIRSNVDNERLNKYIIDISKHPVFSKNFYVISDLVSITKFSSQVPNSHIKEMAESALGSSLSNKLILDIHNPLIKSLVRNDIGFYFQFIESFEKPKAKHIMKICNIFTIGGKFEQKTFNAFLEKSLNNFGSLSAKKRVAILRFLTLSITFCSESGKSEILDIFWEVIIDFSPKLSSSEHNELSFLLNQYARSNITNNLNKIIALTTKKYIYSDTFSYRVIYLPFTAYLYILSNSSTLESLDTEFLTFQGDLLNIILQVYQHEIPSYGRHAISAMIEFLKPYAPPVYQQMLISNCKVIMKHFDRYSYLSAISSYFVEFMNLVVKQEGVDAGFIDQYKTDFLSKQDNSRISSEFVNFNLSEEFRVFSRTSLRVYRRILIKSDRDFTGIVNCFVKNPTFLFAEFLLERVTDDYMRRKALVIFEKLIYVILDSYNYLPVFLIYHKLYRLLKDDSSMIESFREKLREYSEQPGSKNSEGHSEREVVLNMLRNLLDGKEVTEIFGETNLKIGN